LAKEQSFQFGVKELWRDGKRLGLGYYPSYEFIGWVIYHISSMIS